MGNKSLFEELRGYNEMIGVLMELAKILDKVKRKGDEIRGKQEEILRTIDVLQSLGHSAEEIKKIFMVNIFKGERD